MLRFFSRCAWRQSNTGGTPEVGTKKQNQLQGSPNLIYKGPPIWDVEQQPILWQVFLTARKTCQWKPAKMVQQNHDKLRSNQNVHGQVGLVSSVARWKTLGGKGRVCKFAVWGCHYRKHFREGWLLAIYCRIWLTENYAKNMRKKSRDGKLAVEQTMVKVNRGSMSATSLSMCPNPDDRIK